MDDNTEICSPVRTSERSETEDAIARTFSTEAVAPRRDCELQIDILEPSFATERKDKVLLKTVKSSTESEDPHLEKLRNESEEPSSIASRTLHTPPRRTFPITERPEPKEPTFRIDNAEPSVAKSSTESEDPNLPNVRSEILEARWIISITDRVSLSWQRCIKLSVELILEYARSDIADPKWAQSKTLTAEPNRATDLTESELPRSRKSSKLILEPKRTKLLTDMLEDMLVKCITLQLRSEPNLVKPKTDAEEPERM
jgi:hypothetical protein